MRTMSGIWPVEPHENKKVIPMILLGFLMCFNYSLLRDIKDILTLDAMPIAVIPWLKFCGVLPASIMTVLVFNKMSTVMSKPAIFNTFMSVFIAFFALYGLILLPLKPFIEPGDRWISPTTSSLPNSETSMNDLPPFLVPLISIGAYWSTALLYVMSELWGIIGLSLLFWGFANDICSTSEAERFYVLFNAGGNLSLIFSGGAYLFVGSTMMDEQYEDRSRGNDQSTYVVLALVVVFGLVSMAIYAWMQRHVVTDLRLCRALDLGRPVNQGSKPTFAQSLSIVLFNSYILLIGVMVVVYGLAINFVEIYYKDCWSRRFLKRSDLFMFHGKFAIANGCISMLLLVFVGGKSIRVLGWTKTAMITPITIIATALPFLTFYIVDKYSTSFSLDFLVWWGFVTIVLSKSCKYSFFDPVKEMTFIPLGDDRSRAKSAVDVVGTRFGKAVASVLQLLLQSIFWTFQVSDYVEVLVGLLIISVGSWSIGTIALGRKYDAMTADATANPHHDDGNRKVWTLATSPINSETRFHRENTTNW